MRSHVMPSDASPRGTPFGSDIIYEAHPLLSIAGFYAGPRLVVGLLDVFSAG